MKRVPKRIRPRALTLSRVGSSRDTRVLGDIALSGMLTTGQIERLTFPSRRRAQRRLRAYLDHGLVRAHLQGEAMHRDSVWTATAAGLEFLAERGAGVEGARPYRPRVRSQKLSHALLLREVTVSLLLAERAGLLELDDLRHDDDLASEPVFVAAGLVPDGYALLKIGTERSPLLWEAVSERQPFAQVSAKLHLYERAVAGGAALFRHPALTVLIVFENDARRLRVAALAAGLGVGARIQTLSVDEARDAALLAARVHPAASGFRPL